MARLASFVLGFAMGAALGLMPDVAAADATGSAATPLIDEVAASQAWQHLLFYVPRWFRQPSSIVTAQAFFLAPSGRADPGAELAATLAAFANPLPSASDSGASDDDHALCRYPARYQLLRQHFPIAVHGVPHCRAYQAWREVHPAKALSLVFSSYFPDNPASLFGHTYLRLHHDTKAGSGLLDEAVDFAANPTTKHPLLYPLFGLTGMFPGTFSMMPYYLKIQEYSNAESRDLWEYPIALSQGDMQAFMQVLWEVGPHVIDYYYVDENCSFIILLLLQASKPSLDFGASFNVFVIPADTVRIAWQSRLLGEPQYRPSSLTRYLSSEQALDVAELHLLKDVLKQEPPQPAAVLAAHELKSDARVRILDAALNWVDYTEKLAGTKQAVAYQPLQDQLLALRAAEPPQSAAAPATPVMRRPERGPLTAQLGLGFGRDQLGQGYGELSWRPTLHSLTSPSPGYAEDLQIEMLATKLRFKAGADGQQQVLLSSLNVFDALSLPSVGPVLTPLAWGFGVGLERELFAGQGVRGTLEGRLGYAYAKRFADHVAGRLFALSSLEAGSSPSLHRRAFIAPGALVGALLEPLATTDHALLASLSWQINRLIAVDQQRLERRAKAQLTWQTHVDGRVVETSLAGEQRPPFASGAPDWTLALATYF